MEYLQAQHTQQMKAKKQEREVSVFLIISPIIESARIIIFFKENRCPIEFSSAHVNTSFAMHTYTKKNVEKIDWL